MFQEEVLRLPRKITYNHHDRTIQIQTEQQRQLRDNLLLAAETVKSKHAAQVKIQAKLFTEELKRLGIVEQNYYRYYYIRNRHEALHQAGYPPCERCLNNCAKRQDIRAINRYRNF